MPKISKIPSCRLKTKKRVIDKIKFKNKRKIFEKWKHQTDDEFETDCAISGLKAFKTCKINQKRVIEEIKNKYRKLLNQDKKRIRVS